MTDKKATFLTFIIMLLFMGILIFIMFTKPGAVNIISYPFALLGVWYLAKLVFLFITSGADE